MAKTSPGEFIRQVRTEAAKVVWPSRAETVRTTIMVLIMTSLLAVFFLTLGSAVLPLVGWVVGVVLLWTSDRWGAGEKVLGTLVWPLGYAGVLVVLSLPAQSCFSADGGPETCTGGTLTA